MIYINNEMPLYIHEVRALAHTAVRDLLAMQPESRDGLDRIDLTHTFLNSSCRSMLLDLVADIFYYFDDHARDELGIEFSTYHAYAHKVLVYFKEDLDAMASMSRELITSIADLFISALRIIRMLFNVEFTLSTSVLVSGGEDEAGHSLYHKGLQNVLSKILDRINEMYFNGKSQYLAHVGDININHRRGVPGGACVHSGYLLAHHSLGERGRLYDESMGTLAAVNDNMSRARSCYLEPTKTPIILDNSAFELGASASPENLITWYAALTSRGFLDNEEYEYIPVLPDVLGDHASTLKLSEEFLKATLEAQAINPHGGGPFHDNAEVNFMVVVQDSKPVEDEAPSTPSIISNRVENLIDMVSMVVSTHIKVNKLPSLSEPLAVWVGMPMMRYTPGGDMVFDQAGGEIRANAINKIADELLEIKKRICKKVSALVPQGTHIESGDLDLRLHILGCVSPAEYKFLSRDATRIVRSLDTSFPFSTALNQEEIFLTSKQHPSSEGGIPSRPWHMGRKMRLSDSKPFTMTILPPQLSDPSSLSEVGNQDLPAAEAARVNTLRFTTYQLDMWLSRLRHMTINQRMFEEWVGAIWSDSE